jgi:hypothetical protein
LVALIVATVFSSHIRALADEQDAPRPDAAGDARVIEKIPQELIERSFAGRETEQFPETVYESIQPIESSASEFVPVPTFSTAV